MVRKGKKMEGEGEERHKILEKEVVNRSKEEGRVRFMLDFF